VFASHDTSRPRARPIATAILIAIALRSAHAQNPSRDTTKARSDTARVQPDTTERWGAIDPGKGFTVASTDQGALAISLYALWRYLNQLPVEQTYFDHLGNLRRVNTRNDLQLHRVLLTALGWIYLPQLTYSATAWSVNSTGSVAVVGTISYQFSKELRLTGGIGGLPGTLSLLGSHPYWLGTDRFLADDYFRPGFTGGLWADGQLARGLHYRAMVGNTISQLGITAGKLTRYLATSASLWWMPTTGEFGPRGGYGDYEYHQNLASRLGTSYTHSRENRFAQLSQPSPDNTQIRLSDGTLLFQTGALAPGITLTDATYQLNAFNAGLKYRGGFLQTEIYMRRLNRFTADSIVPVAHVYDSGWYLTGSYMVLAKRLELFAETSQINGQFNHDAEGIGGLNWYPGKTRNFRANLYMGHTNRSPVGSSFGYYTAGLRGTVIGVSTSIFF
jgi:hypothetical protein